MALHSSDGHARGVVPGFDLREGLFVSVAADLLQISLDADDEMTDPDLLCQLNSGFAILAEHQGKLDTSVISIWPLA